MSERKCYFARAMRRVAQTCGLTLILLISISPLIFGHAPRAQASSVGTASTMPFHETAATASMRLSRLVQEKPNDQLLKELRSEVAALGLRVTALEEELTATQAVAKTTQRTSLVALFIAVLAISASFALQWGTMRRMIPTLLGMISQIRGWFLLERRDFLVNPRKQAAVAALIIFVISFFLPATEIHYEGGLLGPPQTSKILGYDAARFVILSFGKPWGVLGLVLIWPANFLLATGFALVFLDKTRYAKYVVAYAVAGQSYWTIIHPSGWEIGYWLWLLSGVSLFVITFFPARRRADAT